MHTVVVSVTIDDFEESGRDPGVTFESIEVGEVVAHPLVSAWLALAGQLAPQRARDRGR